MSEKIYDTVIIGGGISGLSLAIYLAKANKKILLLEKRTYPFHKVCGEFISNESKSFLYSLGINFDNYSITDIENLLITSPFGIRIKRPLDIGGVGISRFELDNQLYQLALKQGVEIQTNTKVNDVIIKNNIFDIESDFLNVQSKTVVGAYGKSSNIDVKLNKYRSALKEKNKYVAIKYHIYTDFDRSVVELHNFPGG